MVELPGVRLYSMTSDNVPRCQGEGKAAVIISTSNVDISESEITAKRVEFFEEFKNDYTEEEGGRLYTAVRQFLDEARACHDVERCPVQAAHYIDIGDVSNLTKSDIFERITTATGVAEGLENVQVQVYDYLGDLVGLDPITVDSQQISNPFTYILNRTNDSLNNLAFGSPTSEAYKSGELRVAYAPLPSGIEVSDAIKLTDTTMGTDNYVRSTRIALVDMPEALIGFAGVVAGSYWFENPGRHQYRTITPDMLPARPRSEIDQLMAAGINSSWVFAAKGPGLRAVWPVTTAYRKVDGKRPYDSTIYVRHAFDYLVRRVYGILENLIYETSVGEARTVGENAARTFLQDQKSRNRITDFYIECTLDPESPNMVLAEMGVTLPDSIKNVMLSAALHAPASYIQ